jgi:hypothetical protein
MSACTGILFLVALAWPRSPAGEATGDVLIRDVPHVKQKPDFCGEACAAMVLAKLGHAVDQDFVFDQSGLDPLLGRGCHTAELARALTRIGFRPGTVWHYVRAGSAGDLRAEWRALHRDLEAGVPSIVCMRYAAGEGASEHFRLILGFDPKAGEVIYHEPAEEDGAYRRMKLDLFLSLWPLKYERVRFTVIRLRMEPGEVEAKPAAEPTSADYAQHVRELKRKVPAGFNVLLSPPFVVIGDGPHQGVERTCRDTVQWAVKMLKRAYFPKDPEEILDVWLFKDDQSYRKHVPVIFGEAPGTPFGYYSPENRALIMNIGTGGGTLVHEIVHPFLRANFPACPAWFNEGLASLYEQSEEKDGGIHGLTNWRLAGLKEAIRSGTLPTFSELASTTDARFYRSSRGDNYAQARYLCYYLQEKGLLRKFYRTFLEKKDQDPTGYRSLKEVLEKTDAEMPAFEKTWAAYVLGLTFP